MTASTFNPKLGKVMGDLFTATCQRGQLIRDAGYQLVEMWECEWHEMIKADADMKKVVEGLTLVEPLQPRDALFGGRTNGVKLYQDTVPGQSVIRYYDIKSLYPFVNARRTYPVGHPTIHLRGFKPMQTVHLRYKGFMKCTLLPPRQLYIPVLPIHTSQKKLMFPLCGKCAEEQQQTACEHPDSARTIHGTWTHVEVIKAVEMGYEMMSVDEVWHWDVWTETLFSDYINTFYTVKEEASGYPSWATDEAGQRLHRSNVLSRDGITLREDRVKKNPGLRQVAKLALNR